MKRPRFSPEALAGEADIAARYGNAPELSARDIDGNRAVSPVPITYIGEAGKNVLVPSAARLSRAGLSGVSENIGLFEAGEVEFRTGLQECESGFGEGRSFLALEKGGQAFAQVVQV